MTILVSGVLSRVRALANDVAGTRWPDAELLQWVNDGRREMAALMPAVFSVTAKHTVTLVAGNYQEVAVPNAFAITAITHNINSDFTMGAAIRETSRSAVADFKPLWQSDEGLAVQNWFRDEISPVAFWVYPSVPDGLIAVVLRVTPSELTATSDVALPFDQFLTPLVNYVLYRVYSKNAEVAQNAQLAAAHLQLFTAAMSAKE